MKRTIINTATALLMLVCVAVSGCSSPKVELLKTVSSSLRCLKAGQEKQFAEYFDSDSHSRIHKYYEREYGGGIKKAYVSNTKIEERGGIAKVTISILYTDSQKITYETYWNKVDGRWKRLLERPQWLGGGY